MSRKPSRTRQQTVPLTGFSIVPNDDPSRVPGPGEILFLMPVDADAPPKYTFINCAAFKVEILQPGIPEDIRDELGIALEHLVYTISITSPYNRSGYTYECVGVSVRLDEGTLHLDAKYTYRISRISAPETPPLKEIPLFFWGIPGVPVCLFALRRRVYCEAAPGVYLEVRWHPEKQGEPIKMVWPPTISLKAAYEHLAPGYGLLQEMERVGRQRGTGYYPTQATFHMKYLAVWPEAQKTCEAEKRSRVRDEDIYPLMFLSRSSFYDHVHRFGRPTLPPT